MKKIFIPFLALTGFFTGCAEIKDHNEIFDNISLEEESGVAPPADLGPAPVILPITPPAGDGDEVDNGGGGGQGGGNN